MVDLKKINNLLELFYHKYLDRVDKKNTFLTSLSKRNNNFSWQNTYDIINNLTYKLKKYVNKGDRCLIISENRPEWFISDLSIMLSLSITVPAYTTYAEKDYQFIIDDCRPSIIFISGKLQYDKIKNIVKQKSFIKKVFSFEKIENEDQIEYINFNNFFTNISEINYFKNIEINRKDIACIIYTSGTQGSPKGVMLSHGGILNNCEGAIDILSPIIKKENTRFLTWLPLSHSYEHTVQFVQITVGAKIFYAEGIEKLIKNMNDCRPEIMTAVPRFYQNLYQKINASFNKVTGFRKILVNRTLVLGTKKIKKISLTYLEKLENKLLDKLVRKKIKSQFGGNLKTFVSGGGALDKEVGFFLNAIGLPTLQGYGLTETSPVVSCNPINDIRVDSVGPPFKGNEVRIANDGEIIVRGENVMIGYWNNKTETDKVLKNGWLYTGDIGIIEENYLKITDRKKDILITPGGENISPLKIENELINSEFFEQAIIYGDNKPYLVALLVIKDEKKNCKDEEIKSEIEKINKKLSKIEKIKKYFIINKKFSIENGMLTPTLKLKRFKIIQKYKNLFEDLY